MFSKRLQKATPNAGTRMAVIMQLTKLTLWLLRILNFPLIFLTASFGFSTMNPSAVCPENWQVAPSSESMTDPNNPAKPPMMMMGNWTGLFCSASSSTKMMVAR